MRHFWPEWFSVALYCTVVLSIYFWRVHYDWWHDVSCRDRIAGNEYCTFVCVSGVRHNQVKINMFWGVRDHANTFWSLDCIGKQNCLGNTRVLRSFDTGVPHRTLRHLVKVSETILQGFGLWSRRLSISFGKNPIESFPRASGVQLRFWSSSVLSIPFQRRT